jgi:hypothetical protein
MLSVLVRIDNIPPGHGYTQRRQRVQNPNRARMRGEDVGQSAIRLRRFIEIAPA